MVKSDDIFRWSLFSAAIQSSSTVITYCSKHVTSSVVSLSDDVVKFMFNMRKQENTFPPTLRGRNSSCNRNLSEVLSTRPDFGGGGGQPDFSDFSDPDFGKINFHIGKIGKTFFANISLPDHFRAYVDS